MMKRTFGTGLLAGLLLGSGATAWFSEGGESPRAVASFPDAYSVMEGMRAGGVPCATNIFGGKYPPSAFTCTLEGRVVRVISQAQGGPDEMPRGPALDGPTWSVSTPSVRDLLRIQAALGGGELR